MKTTKFFNLLFLTMSLIFATSCQDEVDDLSGDNPNTNSATSPTATNLERASMRDGSFDDFLDGSACTSVVLPVVATVNGSQVTIASESDYQLVLDIIGEFTNDDDTVIFQFPITVRNSNYTEAVITNQSEFDALVDACEQAEANGEDAVNCLDINFPISIFTYDVNAEQTGSVVLESEQELYAFINNLDDDTRFSVSYPISATANGNTSVTISSDADLQSEINECLAIEDDMDNAEDQADTLEDVLVDGLFRVDAFVTAGVDTAVDYAEFTIDFANDLSVVAENTVNATVNDVQGTYQVASELEVFLSLEFNGNATFELLNNTWEVTSFSETTISMQSTTDATVTLILSQI